MRKQKELKVEKEIKAEVFELHEIDGKEYIFLPKNAWKLEGEFFGFIVIRKDELPF